MKDACFPTVLKANEDCIAFSAAKKAVYVVI